MDYNNYGPYYTTDDEKEYEMKQNQLNEKVKKFKQYLLNKQNINKIIDKNINKINKKIYNNSSNKSYLIFGKYKFVDYYSDFLRCNLNKLQRHGRINNKIYAINPYNRSCGYFIIDTELLTYEQRIELHMMTKKWPHSAFNKI